MEREARANKRLRGADAMTSAEARLSELFITIQRISSRGAGVDDYFASLHELTSIMKMSTGSVIEPGQLLYRATKHHASVPQHIREVLYPPADRITALGRCNRVGQALFYCSSDSNCVLEEIWPKAGDLVVRATWRTTKRAYLHDIGYCAAVFERAETTRQVPPRHREFAERLDGNAQRIRDFIGLAFTDRTSGQYPLTAAIANFYLRSESDAIVGVMYPSMTRKGNSDNIALFPAFVDGGLELVGAEAIRVRRWNLKDPDGPGIGDLRGVNADGSLVWAYSGLEPTQLPPGEGRHLYVKFGETMTCQNDGEVLINNCHYVVKAGFTIESHTGGVIVKNQNGNIVPPLEV